MSRYVVTLDPPAVALQRAELDLNGGPIMVDQKGIDWGDAAIQAYMANEQRWGSTAVSYRVPNRTVTIPLFVSNDPAGGFSAAYDALRQKVARMQLEGGWLKRDTGRGSPMYADVQSATLGFPDVYGETGHVEPNVMLHLECLPDFYGDTVTLDPLAGTGEIVGVLKQGGVAAVIAGDYPARCQINVANGALADQLGLLWSFRSRHIDTDGTAAIAWGHPTLQGAAGAVVVADGGALDGSAFQVTPSDGNWTEIARVVGRHVGSYQVWARVRSPGGGASPVNVRAAWGIGDSSSLILNAPLTIHGGYYLLNLGQVRLDPYPVGDQTWVLPIQGQGMGVPITLDEVYLQPLDETAGRVVGSAANPAVRSSGNLLLRSETTMRTTSSASVYAPVSPPIGDLPRVPPSGFEGRQVEAFFRPSRGDFAFTADAARDPFSVTVSYRPTYLFPR